MHGSGRNRQPGTTGNITTLWCQCFQGRNTCRSRRIATTSSIPGRRTGSSFQQRFVIFQTESVKSCSCGRSFKGSTNSNIPTPTILPPPSLLLSSSLMVYRGVLEVSATFTLTGQMTDIFSSCRQNSRRAPPLKILRLTMTTMIKG